jgi:hypothetical protein
MKDLYKLVLAEIIQGYSIIRQGDVVFYFKHPVVFDVLQQSLHREDFDREADVIGLKSEKELLQVAYDTGNWSKEKDNEIESLLFSIKSKNKFLPKVQDQNIRKEIISQIERDESDYNLLQNNKQRFILSSKEAFIEKKMASLFYKDTLFYDLEFKNAISNQDLSKCFSKYYEKLSLLNNNDLLLRASFSNEFFDYFIIYSDLSKIFNKSGLDLTIFQKNLLIFGNTLLNKLKNCSKMPDEIKNDAIKIYNWSESGEKSKSNDSEDFNIREKVKRSGGLEKMKPEDKLT